MDQAYLREVNQIADWLANKARLQNLVKEFISLPRDVFKFSW